ncbi:MAG TPA: hypothetical protein VGP64_18045 [Polyangia bacterium]|jgi:hypothetical protein
MIAAGYCLDLYCDTPNCPTNGTDRGVFEPVQFTGELGSKCRKLARKRGWLFGRPGLPDLCPACARAPKPPLPANPKPPRRGGLSAAAELFEQQAHRDLKPQNTPGTKR